MPRARGEKISAKRDNLTDFGTWFWRIADSLGVSDTDIAKRSSEVAPENKISQSTISKSTRTSESADTIRPTIETVQKLYRTFELIAREQHVGLPKGVKHAFYHARPAQHATEEESDNAHESLGWIDQVIEHVIEREEAEHLPTDHT